MSATPPNLVGSILQSHLVQRQAARIRDNDEASRTNAARQQAASADEKDTTVGTADSDTQVHTDAEGAGGQGRAFTTPEDQDELNTDAPDAENPLTDEGRNIDLQA